MDTNAARSPVEEARRAAEAREWPRALELLREARGAGGLDGPDLELLAAAERWAGRPEGIVDALEEAHRVYARGDEPCGAARAALALAFAHSDAHETALAGAWLERAERILGEQPECAEHALLAWQKGRALGIAGRLDAHEEQARTALEIARRQGAAGYESLARLDLGHVALARGEPQGLESVNRAVALVVAGDVGTLETGVVFCGAVWAYRSCGRWALAEQWSSTADRWNERERTGYFPGLCRVHRSEVLRARGRLAEAEEECLEAVRMLEASIPRWAAAAHAELGEVRRRRGELGGAMEGFRRALELGWDPQPGLSLLLLAQGDAEAAHHAIERLYAGEPPFWLLEDWANLLRARVAAAVAARREEVAEGAARELRERADRAEGAWERAYAAEAEGELTLYRGEAGAAVGSLMKAKRLWGEQETPYELAAACALLGRALAAQGDLRGAELELDAAHAGFGRIGAEFDAERVRALQAELGDGTVAASAAPEPALAPAAAAARMLREGDVWAVTYGGRTVRLRRTRGLDHLARLLASPERELAALVLAADSGAAVPGADTGAVLDREARAAYRARLGELEEELEEARELRDEGRQEAAAAELERLGRELSASVGLGGRARRGPSAAERARQSVTKAIRGAIRRLQGEHAALGRHLEASVRTGSFCRYAPEHAVGWEVTGSEEPDVTS